MHVHICTHTHAHDPGVSLWVYGGVGMRAREHVDMCVGILVSECVRVSTYVYVGVCWCGPVCE